MPFGVEFSNTVLNSLTEDKVYITNIGCDIVVPDSKPDVIKIISVTARTDVKEVSVKKDRITFLGCANYDIVYFAESDSDRIKTITYQAPISHQDDFFGFEEGDSISVESVCHKCTFSLNNSRKITVSSPVEFKVYAIHNSMIDMAGVEECDYTLPCLSKKITPINRVLCLNDHFSIEDTMKIEDFDVMEIIKVHSVITDREYRIISNKTFVKGKVHTTVIFFDEEMKINSRVHISDFSEVIESRSLSQDMICDVSLEISGINSELYVNSGVSEIDIRLDVRVTLSGYEELDMDIVYDAYCPDYKTDIIKEKLDIPELVSIGDESMSVKEIIDFEKDKCEKVALSECDIRIKDNVIDKEKIRTSGVITLTITYIGDNNSMIYTKVKDVEFESVCDAKGCVSGDTIHTRINHNQCDIKYLQGNKAEITVPLVMEHTVVRHIQTEYIKSVSLDEGSPYNKTDKASITIHFAKESDTLWEIAKEYHTTVEDIVAANEIDENIPLKTRQKLLIPKRV